MKNIFRYLIMGMGLSLTALTVGCGEVDSEITELNTTRAFSPTGMDVRIVDKTGVRLQWNVVARASSYVIEILNGENVVVTKEGITNADIPYVITSLEGETTYTARIKAVGTGVEDSKWVVSIFTTDAENIFKAIDPENDLQAKQVTLKWPAGESADVITVTPVSNPEAATVTYTIKEADITVGAATVAGLTPETDYKAVMTKGTKTRGITTFTTLVDLDGATPIYASADLTADAIKAVFDAAEDGAKICLLPSEDGTMNAFPSTSIALDKEVVITALSNKPVIADFSFSIEGAGNVVLSNITFNASDAKAFMEYKSAKANSDMTIQNCVFTGKYSKVMAENSSATETQLGTLAITECTFSDLTLKDRFIDFQGKKFNFSTVNVKDNTFDNIAGKDFMRFDYAANRVTTYNIENNTFYDIKVTDKGVFYIRSNKAEDKYFTCNVKKNIFVYSTETTDVVFSGDAKTDNLIFSDNYYFNASSLLDSSKKAYDASGNVLNSNPYKDVAQHDFTIVDDDLKAAKVGAKKWYE